MGHFLDHKNEKNYYFSKNENYKKTKKDFETLAFEGTKHFGKD